MRVDPKPILAAIKRHRGELFTTTVRSDAWAELRPCLDGWRADWLCVRFEVTGVWHFIIIASAELARWQGARRIDQAESLRLARLWMNLRDADCVTTSASWSGAAQEM
jgi:hypothetical protein